MVVSSGSSTHDHVMGMECGSGDGRSAVLAEEARIRLNSRKFSAVEVEDLDSVGRGAAVVANLDQHCKHKISKDREGKGTYTEKTGRCSCTLAVLRTSFVVWNTFNG